jgi:hypothetical protein
MMRVLLYKNRKYLIQHMLDTKEEQLKVSETKTKKQLPRLGWMLPRPKVLMLVQRINLSHLDSNSGNDDDMFEIMATYSYDEDYINMAK